MPHPIAQAYILILLLLSPLGGAAQRRPAVAASAPTVTLSRTIDDRFAERYQVLRADTAVRHGMYRLTYRGETVESGRYERGQRVGVWEFRNFREVTLRYDYTRQTPTYVLPHTRERYTSLNHPCIFLGSPLVPYFLVLRHVNYPRNERKGIKAKVVLSIEVGADGRMTGHSIKSATTPNFGREVSKAAERIPTDEWLWLPALRDGKAGSGTYDITVLFE